MDRMDKVNQQLKREISNIIQSGGVKDPRVSFVTVQYVKTSRDLRHAHVGVSALTGKEEDIQSSLKGLNSAAGFIRSLVGQRIRMRNTPELTFVYDEAIDHSFKMDAIFNEIHERDDKKNSTDLKKEEKQ